MAGQTRSTEEANRLALEAMTDAHTTCNNVYSRVDSARDSLRPSWKGDASTVYQEALVQWLEELRLIVNDMGRKMEQWGGTSTKMRDTEDTNLVTSSRWMNDLNPNQG
ncbi:MULTISPECIES: WXG100 family type VII secretion target [Streptomonospora]|uniref:WXG100 family type VII secretion target n=2 Tax=Streptomonospora TaxID=104204 RepID=A0ABV9SRN6_9ACTN